MRANTVKGALIAAGCSALLACSASPTGRNQLLMFSSQEMSALGVQSFEQIKQQENIERDPKVNAYVQCVANAITPYVPRDGSFQQWEVVVFDSPQVNAFALPGGKIGVYTGLLNVARTQDQLAAVIGHEIAHVVAQHSNERLSRSQLANAGLQITSIAVAGSDYSQYHDLTMQALGLGVQVGVLLPYGREQESEADVVGLDYMAQAGFDPSQSIALWQNMAKASQGQQPPELLSTHPSYSHRIRDLKATQARLPQYNKKAPDCERFLK
ncbi:Beta-barrel assembly-enhancing protease [Vibrio stylophorae]|uniref:Beta-barrel assembly-enhancing protease n=1 Tax=Vibrio stylophorae TaxID=659351 RepID=A0ABM8ZR68_9VIBR|nr:M48 family metallopeptidase [Vibrio stylophorae]CAH0532719.1 Beta-barrel assembly-enhancing protease [Vibrio stylophorae]